MSYFDYKFEPDEADATFDLFKTPYYKYVSGQYLYGDAKVLHDIQEALGKIDVIVDNVEVEHDSIKVYPEVSIRGHMDPDIRRKYTGFTVGDFVGRFKTTIEYFATKIIFNPPATVILWADGTKTVVKCGEHDEFDPEKGLVMAITKKLLGNKGNYYNVIKNLLKEAEYQYDKDDNFWNGYKWSRVIPKTVDKRLRWRHNNDQGPLMHKETYFECPICGDEILKSGARYCANCGQRLMWEEK